jgi:hypothetical protein
LHCKIKEVGRGWSQFLFIQKYKDDFLYFRFWKRGGGFKEDDAVWAEPKMPQNTGLPELKALNPDHCFVAALGTGIRLKASKKYN